MAGFNLLGLNPHTENSYSKHPYDLIEEVLKGSSSSLDSFKEVEEALSKIYTKDLVDALLLGYDPENGSIEELLAAKQDVLTEAQLAVLNGNWQPAGEYLTEHLDLSNYALKSEIPTDYLTEEQYTGTYSKPEGGIPASDLAEGVIPTTLPASDVAEWAKADTKPTYTADEVGALSKDTSTIELVATDENNNEITYTIFVKESVLPAE